MQKPADWNEGTHPYGVSFGCKPGEYNDLATALLSRPPETIRRMFSLTNKMHNWRSCATDVPCNFTVQSLGLMSVVYLALMALASGIAVPGGLFMPSIMVRTMHIPMQVYGHCNAEPCISPSGVQRCL